MSVHNNLAVRAAAHPERIGFYMHTAPTGRKYWPMDPRADEVDIQVIAHHLATRARFNGATQHPLDQDRIFYSVAEHSVYCSWYVERVLAQPQYALEALLHDSSEAYNGDLIRPLKYDPAFRAPFQAVEEKNERAHAEAFNLVYPYPAVIKIADEAVVSAEVEQIIVKAADQEWSSGTLHDHTRVAPYEIRMLSPFHALHFFLDRYRDLAARRDKYRTLPDRFRSV